jgi:hypothetical protein
MSAVKAREGAIKAESEYRPALLVNHDKKKILRLELEIVPFLSA